MKALQADRGKSYVRVGIGRFGKEKLGEHRDPTACDEEVEGDSACVEELLDKAFADLPSQVRQVLEAEARLQRKLKDVTATYEELERIAVLFGDPPPQEGDREVPRGRWSFHPNG